MTKQSIVVIDGDVLAYRAAAANEKRSVVVTHNETFDVIEFNTKTEFNEWAGAFAGDYTLEAKQTPSPPEYAFKSMKDTINRIVELSGCEGYHIVISGKDNFRMELPLPSRYKSNRKESLKPILLQDCLDYLVKYHNAEVAVGEADDALSMYALQGERNGDYIVQASCDKDARGYDGWVLDWTQENPKVERIKGWGELYIKETPSSVVDKNGEFKTNKTVKGHGRIFFLYQVILGDAVDGYKPCELAKVKFGEMSAYNLLKDCKTPKEGLEAVVSLYRKWYPEPVKYRDWNNILQEKNWLGIMQMYVDCAHMPRFEGDRWNVKTMLDKLEIQY